MSFDYSIIGVIVGAIGGAIVGALLTYHFSRKSLEYFKN
jgi:hypothetical protein